ncbi:PEP-CTERM sorting domain-containing protein [Pirellulales bacterium]|nr:PEP-CTERM sorting domain-containing protein [Pirellulales bacterium]
MKCKSCLILAAFAALTCASPVQAALLSDGNFSLATTGSLTSNSDWSLIANSPDGTDLAAQFQTGFANAQNTGVGGPEAPGTGTGVWFRSFEGNQGGSGEPLAEAVLTQSVFAPADGDYVLEFVAGREVNFIARVFSVTLSTNSQSTSVDLLTAAIPDGNLGGAASGNPGGTPFSLTLPGVTAGQLLSVTAVVLDGEDAQIPGGQSAFLDGFTLRVPEPVSASLLCLGMAGLIGLRRRG